MHCYWRNHTPRRPLNMVPGDDTVAIFFVKDEARRVAIEHTFGISVEERYIGRVIRIAERHLNGQLFVSGDSNFYSLYTSRR